MLFLLSCHIYAHEPFSEPSCLHFLSHLCDHPELPSGVRESSGFLIFFSPVWLYLVRMMQCCPQDVTVSLTSLQTRRKYVRKHFTSHERILGDSQQSRIIFLGWRQWGLDCAADHSSVWRTALQTAKVTADWARSLFFPHSFISFHFMETWKVFI